MNLVSLLLGGAAGNPVSPALIGEDESLTLGRLDDLARRLAAVIAARADRGARVVILARNEPGFAVAYLGALAAGLVAVPLNPASPPAALAREMQGVGAALVVATPSCCEGAREAAALAAASIEVLVVEWGAGSALDAAEPAPVVDASDDDLAVLLFTSGTGGAPKAAMLTHGCLAANIEQVQSHPGLALLSGDTVLGVLPLFHVFGLNVVLGLALVAGAPVALVDRFDPAAALARIRRDRVTVLAAVPAMYSAWLALDVDAAPADAFAGVRLAVSGAAALRPEVAAAMKNRFGVTVHEGYGLTEASPIVTTAAVDGEAHPGSIGPPLRGVEVRLVDNDGADALEGDPGEIWVRGPNVFAGYWGEPETSSKVLVEGGWLRTGDVAVADPDGWLRIVDRAKDLIIVSGFNVYPAEVEEALASHPDVAAAAVVGEPNERTGEAVVAFVVPSPGVAPDKAELVRHAGKRLARYKLPSRVEVVDDLPRSWGGKLLRRELRPEGGAGTRL